MAAIELKEMATRAAWLGKDIRSGAEWIYRLNDEEIAEIDAALRDLRRSGGKIPNIGKAQFPLPRFSRTLRLLQSARGCRFCALLQDINFRRCYEMVLFGTLPDHAERRSCV